MGIDFVRYEQSAWLRNAKDLSQGLWDIDVMQDIASKDQIER